MKTSAELQELLNKEYTLCPKCRYPTLAVTHWGDILCRNCECEPDDRRIAIPCLLVGTLLPDDSEPKTGRLVDIRILEAKYTVERREQEARSKRFEWWEDPSEPHEEFIGPPAVKPAASAASGTQGAFWLLKLRQARTHQEAAPDHDVFAGYSARKVRKDDQKQAQAYCVLES